MKNEVHLTFRVIERHEKHYIVAYGEAPEGFSPSRVVLTSTKSWTTSEGAQIARAAIEKTIQEDIASAKGWENTDWSRFK